MKLIQLDSISHLFFALWKMDLSETEISDQMLSMEEPKKELEFSLWVHPRKHFKDTLEQHHLLVKKDRFVTQPAGKMWTGSHHLASKQVGKSSNSEFLGCLPVDILSWSCFWISQKIRNGYNFSKIFNLYQVFLDFLKMWDWISVSPKCRINIDWSWRLAIGWIAKQEHLVTASA